jgi:hypothetical protein
MAAKTPIDPTSVMTETFFASMKQGQELAFSGLNTWADLAGKAFAMPSFESLPGFDAMPSPKAFLEASFGFAEEFLTSQKEFALKVVDTMSEATEKTKSA